ncbi:hypothetical protein ABH995_000898 [Bradyrhizobium yuanmingense]
MVYIERQYPTKFAVVPTCLVKSLDSSETK